MAEAEVKVVYVKTELQDKQLPDMGSITPFFEMHVQPFLGASDTGESLGALLCQTGNLGSTATQADADTNMHHTHTKEI